MIISRKYGIAQRFGLIGSTPVHTTPDPGFVITEEDIPEQSDPKLMDSKSSEDFRSLIGSIGYCSTVIRDDISYAVSALSRHLVRPCKKTVDAAKRGMQYLLHPRLCDRVEIIPPVAARPNR